MTVEQAEVASRHELATSAPLPAPGTYEIDPAHTHVGFVARHLMAAKVRGRFTHVSGTITVAEDPLASSVTVEVPTASVDTGIPDRDNHLRSADFFDVERFPVMRFRSTGLHYEGGDRFRLDGELTIRDVTRPVALDVTYGGLVRDPWGGERIVFSAEGEVDREDFGLRWNRVLESGGLLVGKTAKIEIEVEAVRKT
jgi:polyisoprenoid-binding protein YceI